MQSEESLNADIERIIHDSGSLIATRTEWFARKDADSRLFRRRATKAWLRQTGRCRAERQWGKFRRAVISAALILGRSAVIEFEQAGFLLPDASRLRESEAWLRHLARQLEDVEDTACSHLTERLRTYRAYQELASVVEDEGRTARALITKRPFPFGRTLMAVTNLYFLREQFAFENGSEFATLFAEHGTPERLAEAVSTVVALANESQPLESIDFAYPIQGIDASAEFLCVLRYGAAVRTLRDVGKLISILGYELTKIQSRQPRVYSLRGHDPNIEYALRLGFVRGEMGTSAGRLHLSRRRLESLPSMLEGAEDLIRRLPTLVEIKDSGTPFRRIRLNAPLVPQLWEALAGIRFYEDELIEERLTQELELPMRISDPGGWSIAPGITFDVFTRAWRCLEFLAVLDLTALRPHQQDPTIFYNSLMRVSSEHSMAELIEALGVSKQHLPAFLDLISAQVGKLGHYDIQYRPFLRINPTVLPLSSGEKRTPPEVVHASAIVASANITSNVQRAHGIRIKTNAEAFVSVAAAILGATFKNVRTNVPIKLGADRTDVDVFLLTDRAVYLFECKHSMTPAGPHELRDPWQDIGHGVRQLKLATAILSERLHEYLAGLFPGTRKEQSQRLQIRSCVLCSHRVFSGLEIEGIPIRDLASLGLILGDAVVAMGSKDESGQVVMQRYRLRASEQPTEEDLDEFLGDKSRFFATFRPFMLEYDRLDRLFGGSVVVAYNTYVHAATQANWATHLEEIGCVRLDDERLSILEPAPIRPDKSTKDE